MSKRTLSHALVALFCHLATSLKASNIHETAHLAKQPVCGSLDSPQLVNLNTGVSLSGVKTIYTFGDSYTTNGMSTGGPSLPPRQKGTEARYGGRPTNGLVYSEYLIPGATVKNYAVSGAAVDKSLWGKRNESPDMSEHVDLFLSQKPVVDPSSSIAIIFYGINDLSGFVATGGRQGTMEKAAQEWLRQVERLIDAGLTRLIVPSTPQDNVQAKRFGNTLWQGLKQFKTSRHIEFAYVDFMALYGDLRANPSTFGFQDLGPCLKNTLNTVGGCNDPDQHVYWLPGHPSTQTHRLMSEWIKAVVEKCNGSCGNVTATPVR